MILFRKRPPGRGDGGRGRPPRRWDSPPKTGGVGKGTPHKSSSSATAPQLVLAWSLLAVPVMGVLSVAGYVLHGHGVL